MKENSVDAIITDPPYGLEFMGKEWDRGVPGKPFWIAMIRILKPGGFLLAMGGTRTYHRLVCGIEDAGFEIRDTIMWLYGSGFPKSLNIGKQIDKIGAKDVSWFGKWLREWREKNNITQKEIAKLFPSKTGGLTGCVANWELGLNIPTPEQFTKICRTFDLPFESIEEAEREVVGNYKQTIVGFDDRKGKGGMVDITAPSTPEAKQWEGWGTALKPACEPIVVARKPLSEKNVALNVLKWGTGGINIDECRIGFEIRTYKAGLTNNERLNDDGWNKIGNPNIEVSAQGRFPANIIFDEEAGKMLDEQSGELKSGSGIKTPKDGKLSTFRASLHQEGNFYEGDKGGASRFFYCAKASKSERNFGCEGLETQNISYKDYRENVDNTKSYVSEYPDGKPRPMNKPKNNHPTVKPIKLMEYLVKLVSREGATILDPFLGSGTTMIACLKLNRKCIGIEKEEEYIKIAKARIKPFKEQVKICSFN